MRLKAPLIVAGVLAVVVWGWLAAFGWLDVSPLCHIAIDVELLEGDRAGIRRAITLVRNEDPSAYQRLCRYVDRILEERCDAGDPQADPRVRGQSVIAIADPALRRAHAAAGCYVKGSRLIVMRPQPDGSVRAVRERAEALKRAAAWSEAFWTGGRP